MSDRDDRYVGNDALSMPRNTGEFRAAPDISASTAEFKAFAAGQTDGIGRSTDPAGSWPEQPWPGEAPSSDQGRKTALLVGGVILLVVVVALILAFA
jgi:hypothetical protein